MLRTLTLSRQPVVVGCAVLAGGALMWLAAARSSCGPVEAGFWFEDVRYASTRLSGPLVAADIATIASVARDELARAFEGLPVSFSERRDARHRVRVVQQLRDMRFRRPTAIPAESRAVPGLGGQGAVSFSWLASAAVTLAPQDAERPAIIEAIGKGLGRAAVHEFTHLMLPTASIDDPADVTSYEYYSAARREQYFGSMRWNRARPLLERRLGRCIDRG